jgi:hypothetical protein
VKESTLSILSIHTHVITRDARVTTHHDDNAWAMKISEVRESDAGWYECQMNTGWFYMMQKCAQLDHLLFCISQIQC